MALTITYKREAKTARINGSLGLSSVETVAVVSDAGAALASGTICLHAQPGGEAVAEWAVADGSCETDTRTTAISAAFAARPTGDCLGFTLRVKDDAGSLLGAGYCPIVYSCGEGEGADGFPGSGGPLSIEAGESIEPGATVRIAAGLLYRCSAAASTSFIGIALSAADEGGVVQVCRWGAAHIPEWGLVAGQPYWLPQGPGQQPAGYPAGNGYAYQIGVAQDADTLVLRGGGVAVNWSEFIPEYVPAYISPSRGVFDAALNTRKAIYLGGAGYDKKFKIVCTGQDGLLDPSLMPAGVALGEVRAAFASLQSLAGRVTGDDLIDKINEMIALLKG